MKADIGILCRKSGGAILTVLAIVSALCVCMASVLYISQQRTFMANKLGDRGRAIAIAEAGVSKAVSVLTTNFDLRSDPTAFPQTSYGGGSYALGVTSVSSNKASICSTGTYGSVTESVALDVVNVPVATNQITPTYHATDFVMLAGADLSWVGNMNLNLSAGGWMHGNGSFWMNGNQIITGNVSSCVQIDSVGGTVIAGNGMAPLYTRASPGNFTGSATVTNLRPVQIPNLDLTPLYNQALANGQVSTGTVDLSGTVTPAGGVRWVDGCINFGNGTYRGCFVATSNMEMKTTGNGEIVQVRVGNYPAFVSRDGNILVKQAKTLRFNGLIYCKTGSFDKQANGDCIATGQVIAAGNITKNGGWSGMFYRDCISPFWPGTTNYLVETRVTPTAWQK